VYWSAIDLVHPETLEKVMLAWNFGVLIEDVFRVSKLTPKYQTYNIGIRLSINTPIFHLMWIKIKIYVFSR
jgi:hypothetical protein